MSMEFQTRMRNPICIILGRENSRRYPDVEPFRLVLPKEFAWSWLKKCASIGNVKYYDGTMIVRTGCLDDTYIIFGVDRDGNPVSIPKSFKECWDFCEERNLTVL